MSDHAELLRRFQPQLKYDSNEAFFADSATEWTDNPGNVLRRTLAHGRPGDAIAYATPQAGQTQLSLQFLGAQTYADGKQSESSDVIGTSRRDYREMYVALRMRGGYANRMYGHAQEDSRGRLWLQYWFYYFYNDYNLAGGIGLHEGDWEMIQLRLGLEATSPTSPSTPSTCTRRRPPGTRSSVMPDNRTRRSSTSLAAHTPPTFTPDITKQRPGTTWPTGCGERRSSSSRSSARMSSAGCAGPGAGAVRTHAFPASSSRARTAPVRTHSGRIHEARRPRQGSSGPRHSPEPEVLVQRRNGRLLVEFDFSKHPDQHPERLVITINSVDDKLPPRTYTFAVEPALRGRIETEIEFSRSASTTTSTSARPTPRAGRPSRA